MIVTNAGLLYMRLGKEGMDPPLDTYDPEMMSGDDFYDLVTGQSLIEGLKRDLKFCKDGNHGFWEKPEQNADGSMEYTLRLDLESQWLNDRSKWTLQHYILWL